MPERRSDRRGGSSYVVESALYDAAGSRRENISTPTIPRFPVRYSALALCVAGLAICIGAVVAAPHAWLAWIGFAVFAVLSAVGHNLRLILNWLRLLLRLILTVILAALAPRSAFKPAS